MAYVKTKWKNDVTKLNATNMNHIEDGIYNNDQAIAELSTTVETNTADIEDLKNRPVDPIEIVVPGEESFDENSVKRLYRDGTAPHELHDPYFINMPELTEPESFYIGKKADGSDMTDSAQVTASNLVYAWDEEFFNVFEEFDADMGDTCGSIFNSKIEVPRDSEGEEEPIYERALKFGSNKKTGLLRLRAKSTGTLLLSACKYYIYKEIIDEETGETHYEKSYDDKAVIKVNDTEYELQDEYTNLSLEFEAGDTVTIESVEKTYEEETDPETGEPIYILVKGGRFYLNTVKSIHEQVYEKKQVATREQIHELEEALNLTNEQVSANSANIAQNASDIEAINDKLGTVQIFEILSEHMIEPSEDFIGKLVRYQGKLYRAVKTVTEPQSIKFNLFIDKDQWAEEHGGEQLPEMFTTDSFDSFAQKLLDLNGNYWLSDCIEATELNTVGFRYSVDSNVALGIGSSGNFGSATFKFGTGSPIEHPLQYINIKGRAWGNDVAYVNFKCPYNKIDTYTFIPAPEERDSFEAVNFNVKLTPSEDKEFNIQTIAYNLPPSMITKRIAITELEFVYGTAEYEWEAISGGSEPVDPADLLKEVTWAELKQLKDDGELVPGQKYRIIDYVTTTAQSNTISAGHPFDIVVEALSSTELSEDARALLAGDKHHVLFEVSVDNWQNIIDNYSIDDFIVYYNIKEDFNDEITYEKFESNRLLKGNDIELTWVNDVAPAIYDHLDYTDNYYVYAGKYNLNDEVFDKWNQCDEFGNRINDDGGFYAILTKVKELHSQEARSFVFHYETLLPTWPNTGTYVRAASFDGSYDGKHYCCFQKQAYYLYILKDLLLNKKDIGKKDVIMFYDQYTHACTINSAQGMMNLGTGMEVTDVAYSDYFELAGANLPAWELKYCLENDKNRFAWASKLEGTYAFKERESENDNTYIYVRYPDEDDPSSETPFAWAYVQNSEAEDFDSVDYSDIDSTDKIYSDKEILEPGDRLYSDASSMWVTITEVKNNGEEGKGVIYYMKDELNNEAPYDFKNIMNKLWDELESNAYYFAFDLERSDLTCNTSYNLRCQNNKISARFDDYDRMHGFGKTMFLPFINICNDYNLCCSYSNTFAPGCHDIRLNSCCSGNSFGIDCREINAGVQCNYNTFGKDCYGINVGRETEFATVEDVVHYVALTEQFYRGRVMTGIYGTENEYKTLTTPHENAYTTFVPATANEITVD